MANLTKVSVNALLPGSDASNAEDTYRSFYYSLKTTFSMQTEVLILIVNELVNKDKLFLQDYHKWIYSTQKMVLLPAVEFEKTRKKT